MYFYQERKKERASAGEGYAIIFCLMTSVYYVSISRRNVFIQVVQHALGKYLFLFFVIDVSNVSIL